MDDLGVDWFCLDPERNSFIFLKGKYAGSRLQFWLFGCYSVAVFLFGGLVDVLIHAMEGFGFSSIFGGTAGVELDGVVAKTDGVTVGR